MTTDALRQLARSGVIRADSMVVLDGSTKWVQASKIKGLFTSPATSVPAQSLKPRLFEPYIFGITAFLLGVAALPAAIACSWHTLGVVLSGLGCVLGIVALLFALKRRAGFALCALSIFPPSSALFGAILLTGILPNAAATQKEEAMAAELINPVQAAEKAANPGDFNSEGFELKIEKGGLYGHVHIHGAMPEGARLSLVCRPANWNPNSRTWEQGKNVQIVAELKREKFLFGKYNRDFDPDVGVFELVALNSNGTEKVICRKTVTPALAKSFERIKIAPAVHPPVEFQKNTSSQVEPSVPQGPPTPATAKLTLNNGQASVQGNLTPSDPKDRFRPAVCKVYLIAMVVGKTYQIELTKANNGPLDPYLRLEDSEGKNLAENDDGGGNLNSRLVFTCPQAGEYRIVATALVGRTGNFTLQVSEK